MALEVFVIGVCGESGRSTRPQPLSDGLGLGAIRGLGTLSDEVPEDSGERGRPRAAAAAAIRALGAMGDIERRLIGTSLLPLVESESASERLPPAIHEGLPSASNGDNDDTEDRESLI